SGLEIAVIPKIYILFLYPLQDMRKHRPMLLRPSTLHEPRISFAYSLTSNEKDKDNTPTSRSGGYRFRNCGSCRIRRIYT
uniref:Uncharacterized protein n=1 Tax=Parascaris univalens TaxID=6257 RepID=A0A915CAW2_PARUN